MFNQILTVMTNYGVQKSALYPPTQHGQLLHNVDFLSAEGDKKDKSTS